MPFSFPLFGPLYTAGKDLLKMTMGAKLRGEIIQHHCIADFDEALKGGYDIRDFFFYVKVANLRSERTSIMEWTLDLRFSDREPDRRNASEHDESEWSAGLADVVGITKQPFDKHAVLEKNIKCGFRGMSISIPN
jgi:hypothetical protein